MSFFTQSGDAFTPTVGKESLLEGLPVGNYVVVQPMMGPMYFKRTDAFGDPGRMYGSITRDAARIMNTFRDRPRTTGVLLAGEKGSGKSQLARNVSRLGYEKGMPTILVNSPFTGDGFNQLLATIEGPAIVLMDEFEKVYREQEDQEQVLTLLDGVMTSQKLFILTVNDKFKVNSHMMNRPGRLFYSLEFNGLEIEFIREYCEVNLLNQDHAESVLTISAMFRAFNFDMLKAMVEEMNRYDEDAFDAAKMLNAKPISIGNGTTYEAVVVAANGVKSDPVSVTSIPISGSADRFGRDQSISFYAKFDGVPEWDGDENTEPQYDQAVAAWETELTGAPVTSPTLHDGQMYVMVDPKGLRKVDVDAGRYQFIATNGAVVEFTRKVEKFGYNPAAW